MNSVENLVVGIDLGTTNSTIAVVRNGEICVIPVNGQLTMPSAVGLDPAGNLVVGQAAKNQSISAPEETILSVKRLMGLSVKRLMGTEQTVQLGGKTYRPEEISALILGELKRAAEEHLGCPISRAVITVPAFFNERQRQSTQDAGQLAGLEVLRIINEPTAAALAYGAGSNESTETETLLVYDLGGGTFDVSVVTVENGVVEVQASHGDTHLGGDDFDIALAKLAEERFLETDRGASGSITELTKRRLKAVMEKAKIILSDEPFAPVHEEFITETAHLNTEVARSEYEDLISPWIEKTLECLQRALSDAKVTVAQINKVMMVGGATRTPIVQKTLELRLGQLPRHEINPDLIVAMGAAIQGSALSGHKAPAILIDITAHTYSVLVMSMNEFYMPIPQCVPLVRRGTPLPVKKADIFFTGYENQSAAEVVIYQGEGEIPEQNLKLGDFRIEGLTHVSEANEIIITYQIDLNGLLSVSAVEKRTGLAKSITIDTAGHHRINLDAARTNLAALFNDEDAASNDEDAPTTIDENNLHEVLTSFFSDSEDSDEAPTGLLTSVKNQRHRAEQLLERGITENDAIEIRALLESASTAVAHRNWESLQEVEEKLSDLLFYLED